MRQTSTRIAARLFLRLALGLAASGAPRIALAQPSAVDVAQGRELFNQGLDLRTKGDAAAALPKLKAAHALVHSPVTGLELGRTFVVLGKLVEARETFLSIARVPVQPEETARSKAARAESEQLAEQLRSRIPSLTLKISGVPVDSVAVTVDSAAVPTEALDAPRMVDPGSHEIFARSTSGGTAQTRVDLKEGETRDVELKIVFTGGAPQSSGTPAVTPSAPVAPVSTPLSEPSPMEKPVPEAPSSNALAWSLMGGGAAIAVAGGVLMAVEANSAKDANNRHDASAYDSAKTGWTVGLVGVIAGGVALATGVVSFAATRANAHPTGSHASLWLGMGIGQLKLGGTW